MENGESNELADVKAFRLDLRKMGSSAQLLPVIKGIVCSLYGVLAARF